MGVCVWANIPFAIFIISRFFPSARTRILYTGYDFCVIFGHRESLVRK